MSFTVFLGNLPAWVTADDIQSWLNAEALVADNIKVIRNPETQESKGFAFIEAPNGEEMQSIIRRFDRAPLEDKMLRANPAQPPKGKSVGMGRPDGRPDGRPTGDRPAYGGDSRGDFRGDRRPRMDGRPEMRGPSARPAGDASAPVDANQAAASAAGANPSGVNPAGTNPAGSNATQNGDRNRAAANPKRRNRPSNTGTSAFAEELAKAL